MRREARDGVVASFSAQTSTSFVEWAFMVVLGLLVGMLLNKRKPKPEKPE